MACVPMRAPPMALEHVVEGEGGVGAGQGQLLLLRHGQSETQVLEEVLDQKPGLKSPARALGASVAMAPVEPVPEQIISRTCSTSRSFCWAKESASAMPTMELASATWLESLAAWPCRRRQSRKSWR